ncbi:hypothetical protein D3C85_1228050 [compost metagenome]
MQNTTNRLKVMVSESIIERGMLRSGRRTSPISGQMNSAPTNSHIARVTRLKKLPSRTPDQPQSTSATKPAAGGSASPPTALTPTSRRAATMAKVNRFCTRANTSVPRMFSSVSTTRMPSGTRVAGKTPGNSLSRMASTSSSSAERPNMATIT